MTRFQRGLLPCLLLLGVLGRSVRAEERASPPLETRLYAVQGLALPVPAFRLARGPFAVPHDQVNDGSWPVYGGEDEESALPLGTIADVVELLKTTVGSPAAWSEEGIELWSYGEALLGVRGPAALQEAVRGKLQELVAEAFRAVDVDLAVLSGALPADGDLARAVASGAAKPLAFSRTCVRPMGVAVARDGGARAFVGDYDVEVAKGSRIAAPIVMTVPEGLAVGVGLDAVSDERILGRLRAWWAAPAVLGTIRTGAAEPIEQASTEGRVLVARLDVVPGRWSLLPSQGGIFFAVRARRTGPRLVEVPAPASMPPPPPASGSLEPFDLDVGDLLLDLAPQRGEASVEPFPSNYTPPNLPELRPPGPALWPEALVDVVRRAHDPEGWNAEGASLAYLRGRLVGRTEATRVAAMEAVVDQLRVLRLRSLRVSGAVVTMPMASLPEWWSGLDDGLVAGGAAALLSRPGARLVDVAGVRLLDGQRGAVVAGRDRFYVGGLDVEIAEKASIANPIVLRQWEGTSLDVELSGALSSEEFVANLRWNRGVVRAMRTVPTPLGPITCPDVGVVRMNGSTALRLDVPRILSASASGGEVTLLVLTLSRE